MAEDPTKPDNRVVVKLSDPIEFGKEFITELRFKKPKSKNMRKMNFPPNAGDFLDLALEVGDQPKFVIDELSAQDTISVIAVMSDFIQGGHKTGESA